MERHVVSNSGPLMVFSKLNALYLLKELYGRVGIPRAVYDETAGMGMNRDYPDEQLLRRGGLVRSERFIAQNGSDKSLTTNKKTAEDKTKPEKRREAAKNESISVRGSLGVLIEAYRKNLISENEIPFRGNCEKVRHLDKPGFVCAVVGSIVRR